MRPSLYLTALLLLLTACVSRAQKPEDYGIKSKKAMNYFLEGRQQQEYRDYVRAYASYHLAIDLEPEFGEAWFSAGASQYVLHDYKKAVEELEKARQYWKNPNPLLHFYLGECYLELNRFADARTEYEAFLGANPKVNPNIRATAEKNVKTARYAADHINDQVKYDPKTLGTNINSMYDEYLPYLTADEQTIFFTARRPESTGGFNREYRDYTEDFFYSTLKDGVWQPAQNLGAPVNTDLNEGAASFSPDGQLVYFTACSRPGGYGDCDIYFSRLDGSKWSEPQNLGPLVNSSAWESQPCISHDGNTLYFSSNRKGGKGGHDIWYSERVNGKWTQSKPLEGPVNTTGSEYSPFLHADGQTLYFSSNGHPGYGELDLFMSRRVNDSWTDPVNLGFPLNTAAFEGNIFINAQGTVGYVNSNREGSLGKSDLYYFDLDPKIRPTFTTFVRGIVKEKGTDKPLPAVVTFINIETRDTVRLVESNSATGKFLMSLPLDQDYAAYVEKKGYMFASRNFSLRRNAGQTQNEYYDLEIVLEPIGAGVTGVLNNVFFATGSFQIEDRSRTELDQITKFMRENPGVKVEIAGHTDNVGSDRDNQVLSDNRAAEVRKYLISKGVAEGRIVSRGYGETQPVATNDTEAGRALNRRTEFRILETGK